MQTQYPLAIIPSIYFLVIIASALLGIVVFLVLRHFLKKKRAQVENSSEPKQEPVSIEEDMVQHCEDCASQVVGDLKATETAPIESLQASPVIGDDDQFLFKQFVNNRLEEAGFFKSMEPAQVEGRLVNYSTHAGGQSTKFAVICIWKPGFIKGRLEWAKSYQLVSYRRYENERDMPVYVAVGVGGSPSGPLALSFVPLKQVRSNVLSETQLGISNQGKILPEALKQNLVLSMMPG